ncbi:MAG: nicotinate (nicotinamide) nucleotide adenylyltransferase [Phycisphaera sp.]|nr:nicotinate (nicotinamide) nucleotide adenylyltransferase [Phycisphaera sp.]
MDLSNCKKVILFGGTFDPPHVAHVALAREVMQAVGADGVVYIPAAASPFKRDEVHAPPEQRLAMMRLALQDESWASISTLELDCAKQPGFEGVSYTIDTVRALRERVGQRNGQPVFRLLIGSDQAVMFDRWREYRAIEQLAEPLVMLRPPHDEKAFLDALPRDFDPSTWARRIVHVRTMDISSTELRARLRTAEADYRWLHPRVLAYIREHGCYRG